MRITHDNLAFGKATPARNGGFVPAKSGANTVADRAVAFSFERRCNVANKKPLKAKHNTRSTKRKFLSQQIQHFDITKQPGIVPLVESMQSMAYSSRDLARAA